MGYQIKRREYAALGRVHFELWLDGRRSPTATAVVEEGGATVDWNALGDVPPRLALDFAQGLAALAHAARLEALPVGEMQVIEAPVGSSGVSS